MQNMRLTRQPACQTPSANCCDLKQTFKIKEGSESGFACSQTSNGLEQEMDETHTDTEETAVGSESHGPELRALCCLSLPELCCERRAGCVVFGRLSVRLTVRLTWKVSVCHAAGFL